MPSRARAANASFLRFRAVFARAASFAARFALLCAALAACSPRLDWREVRNADDGFVVAMPDRPRSVTRELDYTAAIGTVPAPRRVTMSMLSTGVGPTVFAVGAVRLPREVLADPAAADAAVAWLRTALVRNVAGADPTVATLPPERLPRGPVRRVRSGVEIQARGAVAETGAGKAPPAVPGTDPAAGPAKAGAGARAAQLAARIYVADDRLYQLVVLGAEGELTPDAIDTFFSSFRLID